MTVADNTQNTTNEHNAAAAAADTVAQAAAVAAAAKDPAAVAAAAAAAEISGHTPVHPDIAPAPAAAPAAVSAKKPFTIDADFMAKVETDLDDNSTTLEFLSKVNSHGKLLGNHQERLVALEASKSTGGSSEFDLNNYVSMENLAIGAGLAVGGTALVLGTIAAVTAIGRAFGPSDIAVAA